MQGAACGAERTVPRRLCVVDGALSDLQQHGENVPQLLQVHRKIYARAR